VSVRWLRSSYDWRPSLRLGETTQCSPKGGVGDIPQQVPIIPVVITEADDRIAAPGSRQSLVLRCSMDNCHDHLLRSVAAGRSS
jgi:hypothetical protein